MPTFQDLVSPDTQDVAQELPPEFPPKPTDPLPPASELFPEESFPQQETGTFYNTLQEFMADLPEFLGTVELEPVAETSVGFDLSYDPFIVPQETCEQQNEPMDLSMPKIYTL